MAVEWRLIDRSSVFAVCEFFCRGPSWRACTASHSLVSRSGSIRVSRVSALCFLFSSLPLKLKLINRRQRRNSARDRGNRARASGARFGCKSAAKCRLEASNYRPFRNKLWSETLLSFFFFFCFTIFLLFSLKRSTQIIIRNIMFLDVNVAIFVHFVTMKRIIHSRDITLSIHLMDHTKLKKNSMCWKFSVGLESFIPLQIIRSEYKHRMVQPLLLSW